jgi:hypothetical protein
MELDDGLGTTHHSHRTVEQGEEAIALGGDFATAPARNLLANELIVTVEQLCRHPPSSDAAYSLDFTMSVNSTVASTRTGSVTEGVAVRKS